MTTKTKRGLSAFLLILCCGIALLLTLAPGETEKKAASVDYDPAEVWDAEMSDRFSQILLDQAAVKKKEYKIPDSAVSAPLPDESCYGEAQSAAELQWLADKAADILEGQSLYFSTDIEIFPDSTIHYYLDETILVITWKQVISHTVFTFSEVKLMHPSQFRRYLTGGEFASGTLSKPTEMAQTVNAVVACSADFYAYRRKGLTVTDGTVNRYNPGVPDTCYVDAEGNLILERDQDFADAAEAQAYVDANNIRFSLSFGPNLVRDGEYVCPKNYPLGEVKKRYPRAAICQMDRLHYLFAAANMDLHYYNPLTMEEFSQCIYDLGCKQAYALDGGQSATVVMHGQLMNKVNYASERLMSDIIYFATAKPSGSVNP